MSSMASPLFDPDSARRQIKVIVHNQEGFGRDIEIAADRCNRSAAFIHKSGGPQKPDSLLTHAGISQVTKKPRFGAPGQGDNTLQGVQKPESGVMARRLVLRARITQTTDKRDCRHRAVDQRTGDDAASSNDAAVGPEK